MPPPDRPAIVLDTNVVLDWLVFADPRAAAVAAAVEAGWLRWLASPRMRAELAHMLGHRALARWAPDAAAALQRFDALAQLRPDPDAARPPGHPRCRDADDQVFLDLALDAGARWLLTQDRALLHLARRVAARGLAILTPQRWAADAAAASTGDARQT
ncbi:MAG: PIN domain-containing protein [Burkholderiales bacterium]|nr:PIN domain-containing protein [Burkholderiales bacterium]